MGRPPTHGAPSFRFFAAEVAQMETLLREHGGHVPPRDLLMSLANKFSNSVERSGKIAVQIKQVWNWFQNRRYALRSKFVKPPGSSNAPPNARDEVAQARNVPSAPQQTHIQSGHNMGRNASENPPMEFEAKSARDGAWYDVQAFLSHRYLDTGNPEVLVRFSGFGPEEDEWVNIRKHVRQRSLPCESSECVAVLPGDLILCFQEGKEQALYFDAHVLDAQRRRHDVRGCRCRFLVRYDHDQSEEIVPLRKVCRRPETDYRLQQLHAANESASTSASVSAESKKPVADPNSINTVRVTNPNPSGAVTVPPPTITNVSAQTLVSAPIPSTLASAPSLTPISAAMPSPALTSTPSPSSAPISSVAPSPSLISTPSPSFTSKSAPASSQTLISAPSPSSTPIAVPTSSQTLISAPSPSSTPIAAPTQSQTLISAPLPSSTPIAAPTPSQTLISTPSPSSIPIAAPTPSQTLLSAPSMSSTPIAAPTPSQTLISAPSPSSTPVSAPTPSPTVISPPSSSSAPSSVPTPSITQISAPSTSSTPISGPTPSPALISTPSPSSSQISDASPSTNSVSAPSPTPMSAPSTSPTPISASSPSSTQIADASPSPNPVPASSPTPMSAPSTSPTPISAPSLTPYSAPTSSPTLTPISASTSTAPADAPAPAPVPLPVPSVSTVLAPLATSAPVPVSLSTPVAALEVKKLKSDSSETSTGEGSAQYTNSGAADIVIEAKKEQISISPETSLVTESNVSQKEMSDNSTVPVADPEKVGDSAPSAPTVVVGASVTDGGPTVSTVAESSNKPAVVVNASTTNGAPIVSTVSESSDLTVSDTKE